ncbi:hypothetical protein IRJ41_000138, partial [Triplophysa rosa]
AGTTLIILLIVNMSHVQLLCNNENCKKCYINKDKDQDEQDFKAWDEKSFNLSQFVEDFRLSSFSVWDERHEAEEQISQIHRPDTEDDGEEEHQDEQEVVQELLKLISKEEWKKRLIANTEDVPNHYKIGKQLGKGGYGSVYEAERRSDGLQVALKYVQKTNNMKFLRVPGHRKALPAEVAIMMIMQKKFIIPEILQLPECWSDREFSDELCLLMRYSLQFKDKKRIKVKNMHKHDWFQMLSRPTAVRPADEMKSSSSNSSVRDYELIILPSVHYRTSTRHQHLRRPPFIICDGILDMGSACCTAQKVPFPEAPTFSRQQRLLQKSNRLVPRVLLHSNSDNDLIVNAVSTQQLASRCFLPQLMQSDPNRRVKMMGHSNRSIQSSYSLSAICLGEDQSSKKKSDCVTEQKTVILHKQENEGFGFVLRGVK